MKKIKQTTEFSENLKELNKINDWIDEHTKLLNVYVDRKSELLIESNIKDFKKYEGRFFKTRNSYGGTHKGWWKYVRVDSIEKNDMYLSGDNVLSKFNGFSFECTSIGVIEIFTNYNGYVHHLQSDSYKEISKSEFYKNLQSVINKISTVK